MVSKNKFLLIFGSFLSILALGQSSMQDFFDQNYEEFRLVAKAQKKFSVIRPKLEKFVNDGGNINELFVHPESQDDNLTLLMYAGFNGSVEWAQWLLKHEARPLMVTKMGRTVFFYVKLSMANLFYMPCVEIEEVVCQQIRIVRLMFDVMSPCDRAVILQQWKDVCLGNAAVKNKLKNKKSQLDKIFLNGINAFMHLIYVNCPDDFEKISTYFMDVLNSDEQRVFVQKKQKMIKKFKQSCLVDPVTNL